MTDTDLRTLEREVVASPNDKAARERLERAWVRTGLGWHGERVPMPARLRVKPDEHGVYEWRTSNADEPLEFVHVPGGKVLCSVCKALENPSNGWSRACSACADTGLEDMPPFYLGRFPVTSRQWLEFLWARTGHEDAKRVAPLVQRQIDERPVVGMTYDDARAFCSWAGLELPSPAEWRWAAYGPPTPCFHENWRAKKERGEPVGLNCDECDQHGARRRRYPWGNAEPTERHAAVFDQRYRAGRNFEDAYAYPGSQDGSPALVRVPAEWLPARDVYSCEVKAWHRHPVHGASNVTLRGWYRGEDFLHATDSAGNQLTVSPKDLTPAAGSEPKLVPARPEGASWCGAQDMTGNVHQVVNDGEAWGGSFRSLSEDSLRVIRAPADDVGFRVILRTSA